MIGCIQQNSLQIRIMQEMFLLKIFLFLLTTHSFTPHPLSALSPHSFKLNPQHWNSHIQSNNWGGKACFERFVKCTLYSVCGCAFPTEVAKATADGSRRYVTWKFILITLDCFCVCKFDHFLLIFCVCNLPSRLISIYLAGRLGSL